MMHKTMGILFVFLIIGSVITSQAVSHSVRHTFHLAGKPDGGYYMEVELGEYFASRHLLCLLSMTDSMHSKKYPEIDLWVATL